MHRAQNCVEPCIQQHATTMLELLYYYRRENLDDTQSFSSLSKGTKSLQSKINCGDTCSYSSGQ